MVSFDVTGMSCAACSARVEKAVKAVPGVTSCSVNLLTNSMGVSGTARDEDIIAAVCAAGYGASVKDAPAAQSRNSGGETRELAARLIASAILVVRLMYLSMGHVMWGWPIFYPFSESPVSLGIAEMLIAGMVMVINRRFFISGFKGLWKGAPNMDTLVSLGSAASFAYSVYNLFVMPLADAPEALLHDLYFESAAMILTLISVGKMLEARAKGKTTDALKSLMKLTPATAEVYDGDDVRTVPVEEIKPGDLFAVRPGGSIPVDGEIVEGSCAVDESALTGESVPIDKTAGDRVSAATINRSGFIKCRALRVGQDTAISQIIKLVSDASATKAPIAKIADRVSGVFVPAVMGIALVTAVIWLLLGESFGFALTRGVSVLVISCPCALGLATPVAIMVGSGMGARSGILFKTSVSLEELGRAQVIALDKTGTLTKGRPAVTDIVPSGGFDRETLLKLAASLESKSDHPLACAIAESFEGGIFDTCDFCEHPGNGLSAVMEGRPVFGGSLKYIGANCLVPDEMKIRAETLSREGKTPVCFCSDGVFAGMIAVADTLKDDSASAVAQLRNMGMRVVMVTGDNEVTARAVGELSGVSDIIAGVMPDEKEAAVKSLRSSGKTVMVGDGINDAPALTRADIGVALGAGTDVAIDSSDVVLVKNSLLDVAAAIRLSRATVKNIKQNLFWAFFYNVICIPLAAGAWIPAFGIKLNPMIGAAAMSLSSFFVVSNSLRLNLFKMYDSSHDRPVRIKKEKEIRPMEKTLKIEGMMCPHCEARVKKCLEEIEGVTAAQVSHEKGTAVVTLAKDIPEDQLKKAVENQGYKVL